MERQPWQQGDDQAEQEQCGDDETEADLGERSRVSRFQKGRKSHAERDSPESGCADPSASGKPGEVVFDAFALGDPRGRGCDAERDQEADPDLEQVVKDGRGRLGDRQIDGEPRTDGAEQDGEARSLQETRPDGAEPGPGGIPPVLDPTHDNGGYVNLGRTTAAEADRRLAGEPPVPSKRRGELAGGLDGGFEFLGSARVAEELDAVGAGVKDIEQWDQDRKRLEKKVEQTTEQAQNFGFTGTPSFAIKGPGTNGIELLGNPSTPEEFESAIKAAS